MISDLDAEIVAEAVRADDDLARLIYEAQADALEFICAQADKLLALRASSLTRRSN